jgi:hypothetical protein
MNTKWLSQPSFRRISGLAALLAGLALAVQVVPPARAAGTISFDPASLSFAAPIATYTEQVTVTLTNTGDAPVNIMGMGSLSGNFPYTNIDCPFGELAVGANCTVTVGYFASVIGEQTGNFNIFSDAPGSPFRLPLTGEGLLMVNGSFETDAAAPTLLPDQWGGSKLTLSATKDGQDCSSAAAGTCSMRLIGDGNGTKVQQDIYTSGPAGTTFTLTFDTRGDLVTDKGVYRVKLQVFHRDGSKKTYKLDLPTGTNGWMERTLIVTTLKQYEMLRLTIQYTGNKGIVWFDDFLLRRN